MQLAEFQTLSKNDSEAEGSSYDAIIKPMDLSILKEKLNEYRSFEQFLADAEWMVHNCVILYSG